MAYRDGTPEEQRSRRVFFDSLQPHDIFAASGFRTFMALVKIDEDGWLVVEFTRENCQRIAEGKEAEKTVLRFQNIAGLRGFVA